MSNAFGYDSPYAMSWVMSVENVSTIEELGDECLYPILDNRFNAALRKCITSKPIVAKISRLTEEAQVKRGTRLKSRQILFCLIEYLRPDKVGSQSIPPMNFFAIPLAEPLDPVSPNSRNPLTNGKDSSAASPR